MILSRTFNVLDTFEPAVEQLVIEHWDDTQHAVRRWEYGMALTATRLRHRQAPGIGVAVDVGGAGSPFAAMLSDQLGVPVEIVDPNYPARPRTLDTYMMLNPPLADVVTCISVVEHVPADQLDQFLYHLSCLVAPGGLLFLTCDFWNQAGPDIAHFHWMREQIFTSYTLGREVTFPFLKRDFTHFGDEQQVGDYTWHGEIEANWGYAVASLALVKRA